jgi:colanic acid/amylovoran biosynthesis glycosyltransferase
MARYPAMPRIGVVLGDFPIVSETFIIDQIAGLVELGFEVEVFCNKLLEPPQREEEPLRSLMPLARPRPVAHRLVHGFLRRLGRDAARDQELRARWRVEILADAASCWRLNRCDVLIAHFGWMGQRLAEGSALGILRRPFATVLHGKDVAIPFNTGELREYGTLFRHCSLLLPVCDLFRRMLLGAGADPGRTRVLPTGVDCAAIPFAPPSPMPAGARILTTARLVEKKGVDDAIRALASLRGRRPALQWRYDIVGDGPLRRQLEALAAETGLTDRVRFLGAVPHDVAKRQLRSADIFLLPSRTATDGDMEGVPVSLKEAMAAGLAVVSTTHSGISELIAHRETGLLAPERDVTALSGQLEWAMDHPADLVALARAARARVEAQFDAREINGCLGGMLLDLASRGAASRVEQPRPVDRL